MISFALSVQLLQGKPNAAATDNGSKEMEKDGETKLGTRIASEDFETFRSVVCSRN